MFLQPSHNITYTYVYPTDQFCTFIPEGLDYLLYGNCVRQTVCLSGCEADGKNQHLLRQQGSTNEQNALQMDPSIPQISVLCLTLTLMYVGLQRCQLKCQGETRNNLFSHCLGC